MYKEKQPNVYRVMLKNTLRILLARVHVAQLTLVKEEDVVAVTFHVVNAQDQSAINAQSVENTQNLIHF
jgi:hypothetical protein